MIKLKPLNERKLKKWINEERDFYCFGAGKKLEKLCNTVRGFEKRIVFVADGNPNIQGKVFETDRRNLEIHATDDFRLGEKTDKNSYVIIISSSFFREIAKNLEELPDGKNIKRAYYYPQKDENIYNSFHWLFSKLKPRNKIIFRSGNAVYIQGWDFNDNSKALYDYMVEHGYNNHWKMIWLVKYPEDFPELHHLRNIKAISYDLEKTGNPIKRLLYFYHLCTAKYLFFTDAMYWTRFCNPGQIRVNLWHGNGFKLKKSKDGRPLDPFFDYTTVSGPAYVKLHSEMFGSSVDKVLDTGYAKDDLLFEPPKEHLDEILKINKEEKYVFWLPTFRSTISGLKRLNEYKLESETGLPILTTIKQAEELNGILASLHIFLVIKIHYAQRIADVALLNLSNIKVLVQEDIERTRYQINSLLALSDALISDFSSVAVDYMLLDRPIAFTLDDENLYQESRGFVFEDLHSNLPGTTIFSYEDFVRFFQAIAQGDDPDKEKRHKLMSKMHSHQDGCIRQRILERIGLREDGK